MTNSLGMLCEKYLSTCTVLKRKKIIVLCIFQPARAPCFGEEFLSLEFDLKGWRDKLISSKPLAELG